MSIIPPTVGRKVYYRPSKHDTIGVGAMNVSPDQPLDATILAVWGERCVNVQVLDIMGKPFTKTSALLLQPGDPQPVDLDGNDAGGYVEWMPFQVGQAKAQANVVKVGAGAPPASA